MTERNDLDDRVAQLNAEIAAHPMASKEMRPALAVIEEFNFGGVELVEQYLAERRLLTSKSWPASRKRTRSRGFSSTRRSKSFAASAPE
ncbi:hypothetical protein ACTXJ3_06080 [Brachybacterium paraconglomeratum]|uniref:hypothetical protein n=1 Tax=Brachybacterium paraconglomeratum TaxID=173362 RepID=UPI003FCFC057